MRFSVITLLYAYSLVGCAMSDLRPAQDSVTTNWKKGNFHIHFQAGPRGLEGRSYSYYQIIHSSGGDQKKSLVMESAHSLGGFGSVTNGAPKNYIRIIEDPNGRAVLIEEDIPNDCGPCSNYLWVRLTTDGFLEGKYLRLPSKITGDHGGINYEYPKVHSLTGDLLMIGYSRGGTFSKRVDQIEKADAPTPPG
jgi:hypothetical protein